MISLVAATEHRTVSAEGASPAPSAFPHTGAEPGS
jgi:hypothetical protein